MEKTSFQAVLLDMDGTLIDSTSAITLYWHMIAKELGVSAEEILKTSHGRRAIDVLRLYRPELATWDYVCTVEAMIPTRFGSNSRLIPGARELITTLTASEATWGVVSSSTRGLIEAWFRKFDLQLPRVVVASDDVHQGKPHPEGYRSASQQLGVDPASVLVIEDAPSGIAAAKLAGCCVVGITSTHTIDQLLSAGALRTIDNLHSISVDGPLQGNAQSVIALL